MPHNVNQDMDTTDTTIQYYSIHVDRFAKSYENHRFEDINASWAHLIPYGNISILDIGAGSGRDASWLARKGFNVIAVEPADGLREFAKKQHRKQSIQWINDRLPNLQAVRGLGIMFDFILMNAVWMHIPPKDREESLHHITGLIRCGGSLVVTLRYGPSNDERIMHPVSKREIVRILETNGMNMILDVQNNDLFGRPHVSWETLVFHKPATK